MPLAIIMGWIAVAYLSYLIATKLHNATLGVLGGCSIDLLLEPLAYYTGLWVWYSTPYSVITYFGAPPGNAIGWFLLTFLGSKILEHGFSKSLKLRLR